MRCLRPACVLWYRGFHREGVQHLAFSPVSGSRLCSVGMDAQHCLALWDWASRQLLFTSPTTQVRRHSRPSTSRLHAKHKETPLELRRRLAMLHTRSCAVRG
jgi:hypothetical protein